MSEARIVAIHQPTFLPWMGLFDKLSRSDVFVVLDGVQFPLGRGGSGNWVNRVRLLVQGTARWVTVPVRRSHRGAQLIADVQIADEQPWRSRLLGTLRAQYGRAPHFAAAMGIVMPLVEFPETSLSEFNVHAVRTLIAALGVPSPTFVRQRELAVTGRANDLLVNLVKAVNGTTYLSGDGADSYFEEQPFLDAGLRVELQHFRHPEYPQEQGKGFVAGLSIVDALMYCGVDRVRDMVYAGTRTAGARRTAS